MESLSYFARRADWIFALVGLVLGGLLITWWRQHSLRWYSVFAVSLLAAALANVVSFYLFAVAPYRIGCSPGCSGRAGFPLAFARINLDGSTDLFLLDFLLNLVLLWLMLLTATVLLRLVAESLDLPSRSSRFHLLFFLMLVVVPWALTPRLFSPPEARVQGNALRLAVNAQRAAQITYNVTGLWVHRLALEDIRFAPVQVPANLGGVDTPQAQVCLRGYTYFYIPWRRYRITLDRTGVTALRFVTLPLSQGCWD